MSMQNLGGQTKSIIAFLKVAYQGKRIPVPATAENVPTGKKSLPVRKNQTFAHTVNLFNYLCVFTRLGTFSVTVQQEKRQK